MYGLSNGENIFDLRWLLKIKGQGQTPKNWGTLLFQSTIDIHIQNTHKTVGGPLLAALAAAMCSQLLPNCEGSHFVRLFIEKIEIKINKICLAFLFFKNPNKTKNLKTKFCSPAKKTKLFP